MARRRSGFIDHLSLRKYTRLVHQDLSRTYSRDTRKWLIVAPIIGLTTGLVATLLVKSILGWIWPPILHFDLSHHAAIIPILTVGFVLAGLIMQRFTPDPNEHSTEEIIRSYNEQDGDVNMKPYVPKLLGAAATVGFGGSAGLEGPGIYCGGALGSWLWGKLRRFGLGPSDRRVMLISGAAAGLGAVFRAPLTGVVFTLEMPYRDDLAHEALVPSLIASVVSYATMASFLGTKPLFQFVGGRTFPRTDLLWSALLGLILGLGVMAFNITFRRVRVWVVKSSVPHWIKMAIGGALTGVCGLVFVSIFPGSLIPIGPDYQAVPQILVGHHSADELVVFGIVKMVAALLTLGAGGVSAMFVPLFLSGGSLGAAFSHFVAPGISPDLFAAVGMASSIAAGYKTPLAAVIFVAEAAGGHSYIIPTLIGAAVAYAISGLSSVSGDQWLRESEESKEIPGQ